MKLLDSIARKFAKAASETAVETVKVEAVKATKNAAPIIGGIALGVIVTVIILKSSSPKIGASVAKATVPTLTRTTINTYNYIFDQSAQKLVIDSILKKAR